MMMLSLSMSLSGCRISITTQQQFNNKNSIEQHQHQQLGFNSLCNIKIFLFHSCSLRRRSSKHRFFRFNNNNYNSFLNNPPPPPPPSRLSNSNSFSNNNSIAEDGCWDPPPHKLLSPVAGGIVALGKFDALHIGHRQLAIQAAKIGLPFLMSFVGMAEVLGWEPRAPIVAKCDRERVLSSWAPLCGNLTPKEFQVKFSKVRYLTPQQFVKKLSHELGVRGVVAGQNYRFGFKAVGDASDLLRLCNEYDMKAFIINPVMDKNQDLSNELSTNSNEKGQVSSTRVRHALAKGDMNYVSELLGRHHRLILEVKNDKVIFKDQKKLSAPRSCLLNLPPKEGIYPNCSVFIGEEIMAPCRVIIDTSDIHLELDDLAPHINSSAQSFESLGVDFGGSIL